MSKLHINELVEGMVPTETIYNAQGIILIAKGCPLKKSYIERLKKFHIMYLSIENAPDVPVCLAFFPPEAQAVAQSTKKMLENEELVRCFNFASNNFKIEQIVQSVLEKPSLQSCLNQLMTDDKVYQHSLRTALLAVHMGLVKGYDYLNLEFIAMSALLHDYGYTQTLAVAQDLLHNLGSGNQLAEHSLTGFLFLRSNDNIDMIIALTALQHHEQFDGNGVPFGASKTQITEFARLIAVASYYDNLISVTNNSYRQAIFKILGGSGKLFDPDMVKLFEAAVCSI